ncbi:paraquat-inducible protein A [Desulforhopalus singaporensis]|uniref:Paraquat-inducible protein A n=1 Tax=Desulforhopalus singaporensis TaxID=91360 RepID=A0A1H0S6F8_9BACT|nr:paraquat-inducible protein A [Desulforhopalus singaporensis]SDP37225.1 paraquat-inducible protein A [Desulforhopalus singaporensis]
MSSASAIQQELASCPDCDLLITIKEIGNRQKTSCPRCGRVLNRKIPNSVGKTLALAIVGLLLFFPATMLPLLTFQSFGFKDSANLAESVINLYQNGYYFVTAMVALSAAIFPALLLTSILTVSFCLYKNTGFRYLGNFFKLYLHLEEWAMVEVYLLGIMITIIKMVDTADIIYRPGIFCFSGLVIISLGISTTIDKYFFWSSIEQLKCRQRAPETLQATDDKRCWTAADQGLLRCQTCNRLSRAAGENRSCPRCGDKLKLRKKNSRSRTWALVATSAILMFPANLLPMMEVSFLGIREKSTIIDGIIFFFQDGSYFIGLIIFTASILVPVFKVIGLAILLLSTSPCSAAPLRQKTKLYRFIHFIGRWSMLDIFVIALLPVLVDFGFFTSVHAAPAATYFCLVVAATMFAVITYDPRIMWDQCTITPAGNNQQ